MASTDLLPEKRALYFFRLRRPQCNQEGVVAGSHKSIDMTCALPVYASLVHYIYAFLINPSIYWLPPQHVDFVTCFCSEHVGERTEKTHAAR